VQICFRTYGSPVVLDNRVCLQEEAPQHTLSAGDTFVTRYGVVEVISDDRAQPTASVVPKPTGRSNSYKKALALYQEQKSKLFITIAARIRVRRRRVDALYSQKKVNQASVFGAYFGSHPMTAKRTPTITLPNEPPQNPREPEGSFPNRIVECILRNDMPVGASNRAVTPTRLFLRRNELTERYKGKSEIHACRVCGRRFASYPGLTYHYRNQVCIQKHENEKLARQAKYEKVEALANEIEGGATIILPKVKRSSSLTSVATHNTTKKSRGGKKKKRDDAMYPEVLLSLGFKVTKRDFLSTSNTDTSFVPLDTTLGSLQEVMATHERVADDQRYGAMYTNVFRSLAFKKAKKPDDGAPRPRSRRRRVKPLPPPKPPPPSIDLRALAEDIDTGRYPSMKRLPEDQEHEDFCSICRDGGELLCCDFCPRVVHLKCIRKRFTIKDPEPDDDFLCQKCIGIVTSRRKRAEKRRLEKTERDDIRQQRLAPGMRKGGEYQYLAARGEEVADLVELLHNAEVRLHQALAMKKMNNARRRVMGCYFTSNNHNA